MKTSVVLIVAGLITLGLAISVNSKLDAGTQEVVADLVEYKQVTKPQLPESKLNVPSTTTKLTELKLNSRIVYIEGVIGVANSIDISKEISFLGRTSEPITIVINSPGGSVLDGASIISAMESAKGPVNTLCVKLCASMAAIIHSYGTHRLMLDRAVLMFHPASAGTEGEVDKMESEVRFLKRYVDKFNLHIATRAGLKPEQFKAMYEVEHWIDAEDAMAEHFTDSIVFVRGENADKLYPNLISILGIEIPNSPDKERKLAFPNLFN